ncbi:internal scaffolding protein [Dipodfec virus RodF1_63]|uniref:Internal scaffolding protein n=1 Tax=Dipodfec virus RodF1_63 TaxID=2929305 RepID=A0A976N3C3_9VIRU|nr:internal scaffolding protein [Dipodfec virus RodF1_63]
MKFPTVYTKDTSEIVSCVGRANQDTYKMSVDDNGVRDLKKVGETDMYAQIQSYKDSCDVNYILQRFANGDQSALSKIQGVYGDFTSMPTTLAELSQRVVDAENLFYNLPVDVREQFDHSPSQFFASIGSDKFNAIFADKNDTADNMVIDSSKINQSAVIDPVVGEKVDVGGVKVES